MNIISIRRTIKYKSTLIVIKRKKKETKLVKLLIVQRDQKKNKIRTKRVEFQFKVNTSTYIRVYYNYLRQYYKSYQS